MFAKIQHSWKNKEKRYFIIRTIVIVLFPVLCCIMLCAKDGKIVTDIYLPNSEWNDELIYYKQVEAAINYGEPIGYYGYNESHAEVSSFATWGPAVLIPWIIWGKLFGWHFYSPMLANLFFIMCSFGIFAISAKPNWKQTIAFLFMNVLFLPLPRYILSSMPEVYAYGFSVIILSLSISCLSRFKWYKIFLMLALIMFLTLMRPYMLALILFPGYLVWKKNKLAEIGVVACGLGSVAAYVVYTNKLCADYFLDSVNLIWLETFLNNRFSVGVEVLYWTLVKSVKEYIFTLSEGIFYRIPRGAYCVTFVLVFILLFTIVLKRKKDDEYKKNLKLLWITVTAFLGMFFAVLLFYPQTQPGAKHLVVFVFLGVFVLIMWPSKFFIREFLFAVCCLYLFFIPTEYAQDFYYDMPYYSENEIDEYQYWETVFDALEADNQGSDYYDNTIAWIMTDYGSDAYYVTPFGYLYAAPEGYGINCCMIDYFLQNYEQMQSKYVFVSAGGNVDSIYTEKGIKELGRTNSAVLYQIR